MESSIAIHTEAGYETIMSRINFLMCKGSDNVSKDEMAEIGTLALLAEAYEHKAFNLPDTISDSML